MGEEILKVNEFEYGLDISRDDGVNKNYVTFPIESNLHYRYSSAEALLEDLPTLGAMIRDHFEKQVPRLQVLDEYSKARNTNILRNTRRKEKEKADHRAAHNFGKVICQFDVGYNTGIPIKTESSDKTKQTVIDEFNSNNDIDGLNSELWLDIDKYGRAYEIHYRDVDDIDYVDLSNVFETFVVYDTTVKREPILAVRYPKAQFHKDADKMRIMPTVYTADETIYFKETKIDAIKLEEQNREPHSHKEVPVVEHASNRFRQGIYEDVLSQIDLYDSAQSDTANYMTDLNDALLVISGDIEASGLTTEEAAKQKDANMLLLESGVDFNGGKTSVTAQYIYKQYDVNGAEAYKDRTKNDIYEIAMVPNLTDENFSGVQSGEAMKYKLFGFQQMTATKQRLFKKALMRRYRLLFNLKQEISEVTNADLKDLKIIFTPNLPKAILEELKVLVDSGVEFSQETLLGLASFIESVQDELDRLEKEREDERKNPAVDFSKLVSQTPEKEDESTEEKDGDVDE